MWKLTIFMLYFIFFNLQKFHDEEWADMLTCNLAEIMHNIWLEQSRKRYTCLYTMMSNDYVHAFKQSTLYRQYLQGGPLGHNLDRNELFFRKACKLNDPIRLVVVVANYMSRSSFTNHLLHLKGKEVFGSTKQLVDCPFNEDNDSHYSNCVNFFHRRVIILDDVLNNVKDVCMQQSPSGFE